MDVNELENTIQDELEKKTYQTYYGKNIFIGLKIQRKLIGLFSFKRDSKVEFFRNNKDQLPKFLIFQYKK